MASNIFHGLHRRAFGTHNGEMARAYQGAAQTLAAESRAFRHDLLAFRQQNPGADPLQELIRIRQARES